MDYSSSYSAVKKTTHNGSHQLTCTAKDFTVVAKRLFSAGINKVTKH
jgi:hypothetical protein